MEFPRTGSMVKEPIYKRPNVKTEAGNSVANASNLFSSSSASHMTRTLSPIIHACLTITVSVMQILAPVKYLAM